jgi:hypothetical protein
MGIAARIAGVLIGRPEPLPEDLTRRYSELRTVKLRRGGLMPRVGGWALGRATVDAITLRRTVFLAPHARTDAPLLLHELRHVQQFLESGTFPLRYLWESLRHGYEANRFEQDARSYAARRLADERALTSARNA